MHVKMFLIHSKLIVPRVCTLVGGGSIKKCYCKVKVPLKGVIVK